VDLFIQQCQQIIGAQGGLFLSLFLGGLLGSISHCTGMCGPLVIAQTTAKNEQESALPQGKTTRLGSALLPYHFGRMTTYILLGIFAASLSQHLIGTPAQQTVAALLLMTAGLLFMAKALPAVLVFATGSALRPLMRSYGKLVSTIAAPFGASSSNSGLYFFGVMLGFLPCGLVLAAVMAAASSGNPLAASLGMAAFCLGTMPSLISLGLGAAALRRRWPTEVDKFAKIIMALNGLLLCAVSLRLAL
jgi:sulfite exporter TauE/SafE